MNLTEFQRLRNISIAERSYRSFFSLSRKSKRSIKGRAKGVGQILKHSSIKNDVHVETLFVDWHK